MTFAESHGPPQLLMDLALGKVTESPFDADSVEKLKSDVVGYLSSCGYRLVSNPKDRKDVPIDCRFLQLLLTASEDPEVRLGSFACGVRVGPGARLPRLPALYPPKRKWRPPEQADPSDCNEPALESDAVWRSNYSTVAELADKVVDVMVDQARRGQVLIKALRRGSPPQISFPYDRLSRSDS